MFKPTTFGKFFLYEKLAIGGMAEIFLARLHGDGGFEKLVCIKRILPHLAKDQQFTDMFLDEARLASALNHPNIGQIVELGQHGKNYFIAMEFIDGASLHELIEARHAVPVDVAARVIADTLLALDFAHESTDRSGKPLNIVHRDVTPSNIMVSVDGIVKLVDFGVAKAAKKSHQTQTGAVKGKFAYMAPEQIETADVDRRADIFAIGIVFYELITGKKPFGEELAAVSRILHEEPQDPRALRPDCPEPVSRIVMRALRKKPEQRYPTAHTMLLDIETALRMRNSYVGPREISYVVRGFRGLPLPDGVDVSVHDTGLFASDRSAELSTDTSRELVAEAEAAADVDAAVAPHWTSRLPKLSALPALPTFPKLSRRALVAGASAVGAVTLVALVGSVVTGGESTSNLVTGAPATVVLNDTPFVEKGADPAALADDGGRRVLIDSIPTTRIYVGDTFVGSTPLQTTLDPGRHRIDVVLGDERKDATIQIADSAEFQRRMIVFDSLGKKSSKPDSKRKRRRSSPGSRIRSKIRSLF